MQKRTTTRSRKASSPPRDQVAARTRSLRSQSVDLGTTSDLRGARRSVRQGSAESVISNASTSNKAKGKGGRKIAKDLSAVQEDSEAGTDEIQSIHDNMEIEEEDLSSDNSSQSAGPGGLQPAARIVRDSSEQNFNSRGNAQKLKEFLKSNPPSSKPTSSKPNIPAKAAAVASSSRQAQPGPSRVQPRAAPGRHGDGDGGRNPSGSSAEDVHAFWEHETSYKNKENKSPIQAPVKRSMYDRHPDARKVSFESQEELPAPTNNKRPHVEDDEPTAAADEEEEEESQDEGFQSDRRVPDPARKARAPAASQTSAPNPSKRARVDTTSSSSASSRPRKRREQDEDLEASARNSEAPQSPPIRTQAKVLAKKNVQKATLTDRRVQTRTPWSEDDESLLVQYIEENGCSWAFISQQPGWETWRPNFQVQLKDKARNIKVSYLKAGIRLPRNFSRVRLGKKEIDLVRKVHPDYDQDDEVEEVED